MILKALFWALVNSKDNFFKNLGTRYWLLLKMGDFNLKETSKTFNLLILKNSKALLR